MTPDPSSTPARGESPTSTGGVRVAAVSTGRRLAPLIYDLVKERLLEGAFGAGDRLPVEALRAEFGVSKQPVMDALRRLASDGLVEIIPQVGCQVPAFGFTDVTDFFVVFGGMEGAVAEVAAQRRTAGQLATLSAANAEIAELADDPDPGARAHGYRVLNRRFHALVHEMAHSVMVVDISRRMWDMSDLLINTTGVRQPMASAVSTRHDDHERIIAALRAADAAAARTAMETHILGTLDVIRAESQATPTTPS